MSFKLNYIVSNPCLRLKNREWNYRIHSQWLSAWVEDSDWYRSYFDQVTERSYQVWQSGHLPVCTSNALCRQESISWSSMSLALSLGASSSEINSTLEVLVGHKAQGLHVGTFSRLKRAWTEEYGHRRKLQLDKQRWVFVWADWIFKGLKVDQTKLCRLVVGGVNTSGKKHFLTSEDGIR